jgi:hypothetical protein
MEEFERVRDRMIELNNALYEELNVMRRVHRRVAETCRRGAYSLKRHVCILQISCIISFGERSAEVRVLDRLVTVLASSPEDLEHNPAMCEALYRDLETVGASLDSIKAHSDRLVSGVETGLGVLRKLVSHGGCVRNERELGELLISVYSCPTLDNVERIARCARDGLAALDAARS